MTSQQSTEDALGNLRLPALANVMDLRSECLDLKEDQRSLKLLGSFVPQQCLSSKTVDLKPLCRLCHYVIPAMQESCKGDAVKRLPISQARTTWPSMTVVNSLLTFWPRHTMWVRDGVG